MKLNGKTKITKDSLKQLPWWSWIFVVLCAIIPISTIGGAIPVLVAIIGIDWCIRASLSNMKIIFKVIICFVISIFSWGVTYLFLFLITQLL